MERTPGEGRTGPQLGRVEWLVVGPREQRMAQLRGGRRSRGLLSGESGGGVSAWLWIGSGGVGQRVQGQGGSLWGETRVIQGLRLGGLHPTPPRLVCPIGHIGRGQSPLEGVWVSGSSTTEGIPRRKGNPQEKIY